MTLGILIQARMASRRFPGKVLRPAPDGRPLLAVLLERVKQVQGIAGICVATTTRLEDDAIARVAWEAGCCAFPGSPDDVLHRYVAALDFLRWDACVRLTADCPLVDPAIVSHAVRVFDAWGRKDHDFPRCDYVGTSQRFPEGLDVEAVSAESLGHALTSDSPADHEHVTLAVKRMVLTEPEAYLPTIWSGRELEPEEVGLDGDWGHLRLTVDEPVDYSVVCHVLAALGPQCSARDILRLAQDTPGLFLANAHIERNEGLRRSLEAEHHGR